MLVNLKDKSVDSNKSMSEDEVNESDEIRSSRQQVSCSKIFILISFGDLETGFEFQLCVCALIRFCGQVYRC